MHLKSQIKIAWSKNFEHSWTKSDKFGRKSEKISFVYRAITKTWRISTSSINAKTSAWWPICTGWMRNSISTGYLSRISRPLPPACRSSPKSVESTKTFPLMINFLREWVIWQGLSLFRIKAAEIPACHEFEHLIFLASDLAGVFELCTEGW